MPLLPLLPLRPQGTTERRLAGSSRPIVVVEAERAIGDAQALERRLALKIRDGGNPQLVLLAADTSAIGKRSLRQRPPSQICRWRNRQMLVDLRNGTQPASSGIIIL